MSRRIGGGLSEVIAGAGFGLYLEQAGGLDPSAIYGLALPLGGLVLVSSSRAGSAAAAGAGSC